MSRKGPGLLLRDILSGDDPQVRAVVDEISRANPDIIALQGIDYDLELATLNALAAALSEAGQDFPHLFSSRPNAGLMTGLDLDGDGRTGGPSDAQGYGRFFGQASMAVLSRYPIDHSGVHDFSTLLWRDLPGASLPQIGDPDRPSDDVLTVQRLSSRGHWAVPVAHPVLGPFTLLVYHATPPVFDGPEDRNGRRNHDETALWLRYLDGELGTQPATSFVILGDANLDPLGGDGRQGVMQTLLRDPRLQDPLPEKPTVLWDQTGPLRVDYVLPSSDWRVEAAQVAPINPVASRHALVWVQLTR